MGHLFIFNIYKLTHMKKSHIIAIIASLGLLGVIVYQCHRNDVKSKEIAKYEQNLKAATDSIHHYRMKNGEMAAAQAAWQLSEKEMLKQLNMTADELKDIKKQIGQPTTITKLITTTQIDTLHMVETKPVFVNVPVLQENSKIEAPFTYQDDWLQMSGRTDITKDKSQTTLYNLNMNTPLTIGMTKDNRFFATTPNPYVRFDEINSVELEKFKPKKKHWGIGVNVGPGAYYDFINKRVSVGVGAQIGVNYNF